MFVESTTLTLLKCQSNLLSNEVNQICYYNRLVFVDITKKIYLPLGNLYNLYYYTLITVLLYIVFFGTLYQLKKRSLLSPCFYFSHNVTIFLKTMDRVRMSRSVFLLKLYRDNEKVA